MSYPQGRSLVNPDLEVFLELREQMKKLSKDLSTGWLEAAELIDGQDEDKVFEIDRIHYNSEAHIMLAEAVLEWLCSE